MGSDVISANPVFYDCEATSLLGLPIEVGWAFIDNVTGQMHSEGHLVIPPFDLAAIWVVSTEKVHGISIETLLSAGAPPIQIAMRMNEALKERELYSDAPEHDIPWMETVFRWAGVRPAFRLLRTNSLELTDALSKELGWHRASRLVREADISAPRTHRAEADARHVATLWSVLTKATAETKKVRRR
jgi:hypothetical protein